MIITNGSTPGNDLLDLARVTMNNYLNLEFPFEAKVSEGNSFSVSADPVPVYVILWRRGEIRGFGSCHHKPLQTAIQYAVIAALERPVDGTLLMADETNEVTIEVAIRTAVQPVPASDKLKEQQKNSNTGLSLLHRGNWFDVLPQKIIRAELDIESQRQYLVTLTRQKEPLIQDDQWYASEWEQWVEQKDGHWLPFYRGRVQESIPFSKKSCLRTAELSANRLVRQQNVLGQFTYEYLPVTDTVNNQKYNLVRMAGTTFGMSMLSALVSDENQKKSYEACVEKALRYLLDLSVTSRHVENGIYISEGKTGFDMFEGKLGTSALTLMALQFGPFYSKYEKERHALIETILGLQHPSGAFACYIPPRQKIADHSCASCQNYFPGEALLALAYALKNCFKAPVAHSIVKAFPFYKDYFNRDPQTAFVLWQVSAWSLFHELMEQDRQLAQICQEAQLTPGEIVAFVYAQTDFILGLQYTAGDTPRQEYWGGFPNTGVPGSVSSCYLEAVIRATHLAARCGDEERYHTYKQAAIEGAGFMNRLQVKESEAFLFPKPGYAVGGITSNLGSFKLRNDRDQHSITAFIAAIETPGLFESVFEEIT